MNRMKSTVRAVLVVALVASLAGCDDPQVYGSVGVSTGFGGYHGGYGPRVNTNISIGGRIR